MRVDCQSEYLQECRRLRMRLTLHYVYSHYYFSGAGAAKDFQSLALLKNLVVVQHSVWPQSSACTAQPGWGEEGERKIRKKKRWGGGKK